MFLSFQSLRKEGVPVSCASFWPFIRPWSRSGDFDIEGFYHLARVIMVKDERHFDRFDRAFAAAFKA